MSCNLLIFGFGYTARAVATLLHKVGWVVVGTSRKYAKQDLELLPNVQVLDFTYSAIAPALSEATHILVSTPPEVSVGDPTLHQFRSAILQYASHLQWLGYLSTTGVYGDRSGAWVNETTTVKLDNIRSKLRFQSECEWLNFGSQISVSTQIFRLASIYGQNRNALKRLEQETLEPIYKSDQLFSRVHVDDIANILVTSMNLFGASNEIYNICDDLPSSTYEVMEYAAKLLKITIASSTGYNKIQLSKRMQEFYSSNKKVKNDKVKKLLGVTLRYPTYKEGLDAMYKTGNY